MPVEPTTPPDQRTSETTGASPVGAIAAAPVDLPTREGYDRWSALYDDDTNPLVHLEDRHLPALVGDVRGLEVADIGCGTGRHAIRLAALGARVTALDFSDGMLARARAKPGGASVRFIRHDLARPLPLDSASFDRVLCCLVVDHIRPVEPLFAELGRICRHSGFVVVSVMHPAMMLRGVQARFTDPATGEVVRPASVRNELSDYVMGAVRAGLTIEHIAEHACDDDLAAHSPRAGKYLGWPMLLLMRLKRQAP